MTGLVGIYRPAGITAEDCLAVTSRARGLDYSGDCLVDLWRDEHVCVARVHLPSSRPVLAARGSRGAALLLHGRLLESSDPEGAGGGNDATHCLSLHETEGVSGFARLNGQFNLVLHDPAARSLFLVNDRLASHPLFYRWSPVRLCFASQVRSVLELMGEAPKLDLSALRQFLVFQTILDESTLIAGIRTLPPAAVLQCANGRPTVSRYWHLQYHVDAGRSEEEHAEELATALRRSTRRSVGDGREHAVLLSGGLDSRALVAAMAPMPAITLSDWENAEVRIARAIARRGALALTFVRRPADFYPDLVDLGTTLGDGAYRFDNAHFARLRSVLPPNISALVSGYGFDLLLKGDTVPRRRLRLRGWPLNRHAVLEIPDVVPRHQLTDIVLATMGDCLWNHPATTRLVHPGSRSAMVEDVRTVVGDLLDRACDHAPTPAQRCEYVRMNMMATRFSAYLNVLSIRHFFRDCTVSLDNDVLDQHLRIPPRLRLDARVYKSALARLDRKMCSIPDANTGFPPNTHFLVEHLAARSRRLLGRLGLQTRATLPDPAFTHGSWPNMSELIRSRPAFAARIAATIGDDSAVPGDVFDVPYLKGLLADHLERRVDAAWPLLLVLTAGTWIRANLAGRAGAAPATVERP